MKEVFGHFDERALTRPEFLIVGFSPKAIPIQKRWQTKTLSADFIADYLNNFFVGRENVEKKDVISIQSHNAVKYIANELLENAMKFRINRKEAKTEIAFYLSETHLIFVLSNCVNQTQMRALKKFIQRLENQNPQELYLQQMEYNAVEDHQESGLGLLSMICDYGAQLGWQFQEEIPNTTYKINTMVTLEI